MVNFEELIKDITERVIAQLIEEKKKSNDGIPSNIDKKNYIPPDGGKRLLITEKEIMRAFNTHQNIEISSNAIITPLAHDMAKEKNVRIIIDHQTIMDNKKLKVKNIQKIAIGSDHGGYDLKEKIKNYLFTQGYMYKDFGTHSKASVDYPDFAFPVARSVISGECDMGIVIDGAGIGSAICANKINGILAAVCHDKFTAKIAREHDNANILTMGANVISTIMAKEVTRIFLTTEFAGGRHTKRIEKILKIEQQKEDIIK